MRKILYVDFTIRAKELRRLKIERDTERKFKTIELKNQRWLNEEKKEKEIKTNI